MVPLANIKIADVINSASGSDQYLKWLKFILEWECEINRAGYITIENLGDGAGITVAGLTARDDDFPGEGITAKWIADKFKTGYWDKCGGDTFKYPIGPVVANFGVNCGIETAIIMLQLAICDHGLRVVCDGELGPITIKSALQLPNSVELALGVIAKGRARYKRLAEFHPNPNARFLKGWLNRTDALTATFCS
jgi:lysozyme family protein